jgi:hypothetical protein
MNRFGIRRLFSAVQTALVLTAATTAWAGHTPLHKRADGLDVYIGVLPAELVQGHGKEHGGTPRNRGTHHVVVALFDSKTGDRITDAQVSTVVSEPGLAGQEKKLEPMEVATAMSYGNWFKMPGAGPYRIVIEIKRPDAGHPVKAVFEYRHP